MRCRSQLISGLVILCTVFLAACNSDDRASQTALGLDAQNDSVRQIMALGDNPLKAVIRVNGNVMQVFDFDALSTDFSVDLPELNVGESYEVNIIWIEVLNGFDVEISRQRQGFIAETSVTIDAPHNHTDFDYDGDGVSNFDERRAETCVWRLDNACELDTPENNSMLVNGDFSNRASYWGGIYLDSFSNGEICIASTVDAGAPELSYLLYLNPLSVQNGVTYTATADVRSESPATPGFSVHTADTFYSIHSDTFSVSSTTSTVSTTFVAGSTHHNALFGIQFGDGTANRYCIDNVTLVADEL